MKIGCVILVVVGLVFVAIVGMLAAIAFPAFEKTKEKAKVAITSNHIRYLKSGLETYFTEYRRWPVEPEDGEDTDVRTEGKVMAVLSGKNSEAGPGGLNPRKVVFVASPEGASGDPVTLDPWGRPYFVRMDTNSDNMVEDPSRPGTLNLSVLVWSAGPDGDAETWEDNVTSW